LRQWAKEVLPESGVSRAGVLLLIPTITVLKVFVSISAGLLKGYAPMGGALMQGISLTKGIETGEQLKYLPTGQIFLVKKITREFVIFQGFENLKVQILLSKCSVPYLFGRPQEGEVRRT
jgi:hypothetical protein